MIKNISIILTLVVILTGASFAAPSFLSTTGGILAPNDTLLGPGEFNAQIHLLRLGGDAIVFGANVGVTEELEMGIARFDPAGVNSSTLINAKYSILRETATMPSVLIGAVDAVGDLDPDGNPGVYIVVGKNLTPIVTDIAGEPIAPLRGWVGFGSGIYKGVFFGGEWTFSPRARIVAEFINELNMTGGIQDRSVFNAGIRLAITDEIRADAALLNGSDLGIGISYNVVGF